MNLLKDIKIGYRLLNAFGILILMLLGSNGLSILGVNSIHTEMGSALTEAHKTFLAQDVNDQVDNVYLNIGYLLMSKDMSAKKAYQSAVDTHRAVYRKEMDELKASATTETGKKLLASLEDAVAAAHSLNDQVIALSMGGKADQAMALYMGQSLVENQKIDKVINDLLAWRQQRLDGAGKAANTQVNQVRTESVVVLVVALALAILMQVLITRSITQPLNESVSFLGTLAQGDISQDPPARIQNRRDEIGKLAKAMLTMVKYLRNNVSELSRGIQTLSSSSTELSAISEETTAGARESALKANTVATAAEEMSAITLSVASGMEQATSSLSSVATAVEEMTATIGEIANNSERARSTTDQAARQADQFALVMKELGQSAQEIGKVTETITSISAQTNLLALNATIEAARAGAAGKGFAVVASEIKELAQQTAAATGEIKTRIGGIQGSTANAVADIEKIVDVIKDVNNIVMTIAAAIQEQATTTQDIAMNIAQASNGVRDANARVSQTASVSRLVAEEISSVSQTSGQITDASTQVQSSALELSRLSEQLGQMLVMFKV
jgi:methyl-accepting chemotaxis protein